MKVTNSELIALHQTLIALSRQKHPFNVTLAKNLQRVEKLVNDYSDERTTLVERYAKTDEDGKLLGVEKTTKDTENNVIVERIKEPQMIEDIEWNNKEEFIKEIESMNKTEVEIGLETIDAKKSFYHMEHKREFTIEEYLNTGMEPGMILYLEKIGMLTGLDL